MPRNQVAIYTPAAACLYERVPEVTGGAERQATLLAKGLARSGRRVAHIVLPVADPDPALDPRLTLVEQRLGAGGGTAARAGQLGRVWSAFAAADAEVYVFRIGLAALGAAALFCRIHRRRLVFAASSDLDFTFGFYSGRRGKLALYKFGVRSANAIVTQSSQQKALARRAFPRAAQIVELPSFAEEVPLSPAAPEAFLWAGRFDAIKRPLRYVDLAEALPEARFWMLRRRLDPERAGGSPDRAGEEPAVVQEVLERAKRLPNLEILEERPHAEAMRLVERAVAIVNTGPAEGMPNLFLEGWARGIPALSFQFDPDGRITREMLGEVAGGSPEHFTEAARRLWKERNDRDELAARVRDYLVSTHGEAAVTASWLAILDDLTAGGQGGQPATPRPASTRS